MLLFLAGMVSGATIGVTMMASMSLAKEADEAFTHSWPSRLPSRLLRHRLFGVWKKSSGNVAQFERSASTALHVDSLRK